MTAQIGEKLIYNGVETWMAAEPLNQYLKNRKDLKFEEMMSACWRGYFGEWEIIDDKLYLIGFDAYVEGKKVDLNFLFPGQDRVFADWFTGQIRIPYGELMEYVHMDYCSIYEKDIILTVVEGVVTEKIIIDNTNRPMKPLDL